jgi:lysyl-tRNA synthetase class 2
MQQYFELRSRQIQKLRETQDPEPYPHKFHVTQSISSFIQEFGKPGVIENSGALEDKIVSLDPVLSVVGNNSSSWM